MVAKLVLRLLDRDDRMLGWAEATAMAPGDGTLRVLPSTLIPVEHSGLPHCISVHWCDINIEWRVTMGLDPSPSQVVMAGNFFTVDGNWTALILGPAAGGLPPVTVRAPISVAVPQGRLG
jgi:hypothetical protein